MRPMPVPPPVTTAVMCETSKRSVFFSWGFSAFPIKTVRYVQLVNRHGQRDIPLMVAFVIVVRVWLGLKALVTVD
jgi:hypothetical protein